jgi:hypothetical protein
MEQSAKYAAGRDALIVSKKEERAGSMVQKSNDAALKDVQP